MWMLVWSSELAATWMAWPSGENCAALVST